jgi:hypothetical protein
VSSISLIFCAALLSFVATSLSLGLILVGERGRGKSKWKVFFRSYLTCNILLSDVVHSFAGMLLTVIWLADPLKTDDLCNTSTWDDLPRMRAAFVVCISVSSAGMASSGVWIAAASYSLLHNRQRQVTPKQMQLFHGAAWSVGLCNGMVWSLGFVVDEFFLDVVLIQEGILRCHHLKPQPVF